MENNDNNQPEIWEKMSEELAPSTSLFFLRYSIFHWCCGFPMQIARVKENWRHEHGNKKISDHRFTSLTCGGICLVCGKEIKKFPAPSFFKNFRFNFSLSAPPKDA